MTATQTRPLNISALRQRVLVALKNYPQGVTCEQLEATTGLRHQTVSARLKELRDMGHVEWRWDPTTGEHRRATNTSGRRAKLYFASAS
jgi:predicted transcriptional regulator